MMDALRARLRNTWVHGLYALAKYDLPDFARDHVWRSLRLGRRAKALRYVRAALRRGQDRPRSVAIDIVSVCNLRCPLCSVPPFITKENAAGNFMDLGLYRAILGNIGGFAPELTLVYAGEPFLHPHFTEMVDLAAPDYHVTTISNATLLDDANVAAMVDNLDFLQISCDGHGKESYEKYRVGANYDKVRENILRLLAAKKRSRSGLPVVTVTYLINAYNEHEAQACRRFWLDAGAERFYAKYINLNVHRRLDGKTEEDLAHWLPKDRRLSLYREEADGSLAFKERPAPCATHLSPIVRCDGEVLLCCHDIFNTVKIGNLAETPLADLWNSRKYREIRRCARERTLPVCAKCGK